MPLGSYLSYLLNTLIQLGSAIWTNLDFEWSKRGWVVNGPDLECDVTREAQSFEIWTNDCHFFQKPFEIGTKMSRF